MEIAMQRVALLALAPLALAACTAQPPERPPVGPAATVTGPAESCIPLAQARASRIRDDWTIDFIRDGKRAWRNTLPQRCPGLKSADAFSYKTSLSQLCSNDIIYVLENVGGGLREGPGCGLGRFVPVELAD
jgi:hypothetical protein